MAEGVWGRHEDDWRWVLAGTLANYAASQAHLKEMRRCFADTPWLDPLTDRYDHPLANEWLTLAYCAQCQLSCWGSPNYARLS